MTEQEKLWSGDFGKSYTDRNRVDWRARVPFWKRVLNETGARSVTEIGCNAGWNLSAIHRALPDTQVCGVEINLYAAKQARVAGLAVLHQETDLPATIALDGALKQYPSAELVFTAGVLIHQEGDALKAMMQAIVNASYQYVLAVEYAAPEEEHIKYRGMDGYLWKRPYGRLYRALGLKELASWPVTKLDGFDDCQVWLLTK